MPRKGQKLSLEARRKVSESMKKQYETGVRDRFKITKNANQTLREKGQYTRDNSYLIGENNTGWKGGRNRTKSGYVRIRQNNDYILEHRFIWEKYNGEIPEGCQIDHINGNKQDNRIENLRCFSNSEHQQFHNKSRPRNDLGQFTRGDYNFI